MENTSSKNWSIQDYLSLGYLFLLTLGIARNVIYYSFLDINIINYSDLMDILLSPISFLAGDIIIPIILISIIIIFIVLFTIVFPKLHQKLRTKKWYNKYYDVSKIDKKYQNPTDYKLIIMLTAYFITSFFLGTGIGSGVKKSKILKSKEFKISHKITFNDDKLLNVKMFGQNGSFIFYALKNTDKIIVSPIANNIIKIEKLDE